MFLPDPEISKFRNFQSRVSISESEKIVLEVDAGQLNTYLGSNMSIAAISFT